MAAECVSPIAILVKNRPIAAVRRAYAGHGVLTALISPSTMPSSSTLAPSDDDFFASRWNSSRLPVRLRPSWLASLLPAPYTRPPTVRNSEPVDPAATATILGESASGVSPKWMRSGVNRSSSSPRPSLPISPLPHANTVPSPVSARTWFIPHATW